MTQSKFPLWKKMAGSGLFVMLLPIILPTAIVSGVYYASRKAARRTGRRDTEDVLPQLVFARKEPAMWNCSKCGKQYVPLEHAIPETAETLLEEMERDFRKHVTEEHSS